MRTKLHGVFGGEPELEPGPRTDQGEADRDYLREAFDGCITDNDHVAAFDLLDRGRRAAQDIEAVARATTGSSEGLELFLRRADGYRDALSKRDWRSRVEDSIRRGITLLEIAFGQLDRARRDEASSAVRTWHSMTQLRFSRAHRELTESMEELLRFVGLRDVPTEKQVSDDDVRLEPKEVMELLGPRQLARLPPTIRSLLDRLRRARNDLAHMSPIELRQMQRIWQKHDRVCKRF